MESPASPAKLTYFLAEKNSILIVTFVGTLTRDAIPIIEQCQAEVVKKDARWVILNLRDVGTAVEKPIIPIFVRFQKAIRDTRAILRMTSIHPELRKFLNEQGVIRPEEVTNNLAETLMTLPKGR